MKLNRFYLTHATLGLLMLGFVATTSIQAQTIQGQLGQNASPSPFEAVMYPMNGSSPAIKVNFENLSGGSVRVVIRDTRGVVFYDEYEPTAHYRRSFNFSSMPAGEYTIQLSKRNKQYMRTFVVESLVERHIALKGESTPDTDKNVAVKQ